MTGGSASTYHALLGRQDWAGLRKRLKLFAYVATGSKSMSDAEDLAQDAIARVYEDLGARWNPETEPEIFRYLTGLVRGDLSNRRRKKREVRADDATLEAHSDDGAGSPEHLIEVRQTAHVIFTALRDESLDDDVGTTVTDLFSRGVDGAAEQAAESGHSIDDIRRARRRVFDRVAAIRRKLGADSEVT